MAAPSAHRSRPLLWVVFTPFLIYAALDLLCRMGNATLAPFLIASLGLGPAEIGFVTGAFFVGFGLTQFPMGVALDRYGPRPVVLGLLAVAAVGAAVCYLADSLAAVVAGRACMGIGFAGSFMAAIKASSLWLHPVRMPLVNGLIVAMTGVGGMLGTGPVAALLDGFSWRDFYLLAAGLAVLLLALTAFAVPRAAPEALSERKLGRQVLETLSIFSGRRFWCYAPVAMTGASANVAYQTLWAPIWLRDVAGLDDRASAWVMFGMLGCLTAGGLAFSWLSQISARRGRSLAGLVLGGTALAAALQVPLALGHTAYAVPVWLAIGFLYACPIGAHAFVTRAFPPELAARASSNLNFTVFLSTFVIQWGIGVVIGLYPAGEAGYTPEAFRGAMLTVVALQIAGLCAYGLLRPRAPRTMQG